MVPAGEESTKADVKFQALIFSGRLKKLTVCVKVSWQFGNFHNTG